MQRSRSLFRHSPRDLLPALGGVVSVLVLLSTFLAFPVLSWVMTLPALVLVSLLYCWNLHCVAHSFLHNPFFQRAWLNRVFGVLESLAIGLPQMLWHHYHMSHHAAESKGDLASIYRHGKGKDPEPLWRYCLLSLFRISPRTLMRKCRQHGREQMGQVIAEGVGLLLFWSLLLAVSWRYFLAFYVPSYFLGWMLAFAQEYLEHYGAQPANPFASAVNSRSRLYNRLTFNRGYHQEHHWSPQLHWTRLPELHGRLAPHLQANGTVILRGPHLTAMLEHYWRRRLRRRQKRKAAREAA